MTEQSPTLTKGALATFAGCMNEALRLTVSALRDVESDLPEGWLDEMRETIERDLKNIKTEDIALDDEVAGIAFALRCVRDIFEAAR